MQKHYNYLNIDLDKKIHTKLKAKQGDSKSRYILVNLISNSTYYDLSDCSVKIYGIKNDKTIFFNHATVINGKQGQFEIELTTQALAVPGEVEIQILILGTNDEKLTTFSFFIDVEKTIINDAAIESTNEFTALTEALSSVQNIDNRFAEVDEQFNTIQNEKISKGQVTINDINKNAGKFDETFMTDEFLQQITGNTPIYSVPADKSITFEKFASDSLGHSKMTGVYGYQMEYLLPGNLINWNDESYMSGVYMQSHDSQGNVTYAKNDGYVTTNLIPCKAGQEITVSQLQPIGGYFFDITGTKWVDGVAGTSGVIGKNVTIKVPDNSEICYVRFSFQNTKTINGVIRDNYEVVCYGNTIIPYEPYGFRLKDCKLNANDIDESTFNEKFKNLLQTSLINDLNLFNVNDATNEKGYFITNGTTGGYTANASLGVGHLITVEEGSVYSYTHYHSVFGSNVNYNLYDYMGNFISSSTLAHINELIDLGLTTYKQLKITIPKGSNVKYIRLNYPLNKSVMFVKGDTLPSTFQPYGYELNDNVYLGDTQLNQVNADISPLKNKIISCNGDSIMAGAGFTGGFAKIIADRNSMIYENIAVGGATITGDTTSSTGDRHWISRTISNMRSDADYVILEGGVNDASLGVAMGTIADSYTTDLDDTTYCGAFESMLLQARKRFPKAKIGYVFVHKMTKSYDSRYENNYYTNAKKICEKYGVPYKDLNIECPPLNYIDVLKTVYTKDGDGWHPNEEGYKLYYVDQIESWMKTL